MPHEGISILAYDVVILPLGFKVFEGVRLASLEAAEDRVPDPPRSGQDLSLKLQDTFAAEFQFPDRLLRLAANLPLDGRELESRLDGIRLRSGDVPLIAVVDGERHGDADGP